MTRILVHLGHDVVHVEFDRWTLILYFDLKIWTAKLIVTNNASKLYIA